MLDTFPRILARLGPESDPFRRRILAQPPADIIRECAWRARGAWDCNERESYAYWHALAHAVGGPDECGPWASDWYAYFLGRADMLEGPGFLGY